MDWRARYATEWSDLQPTEARKRMAIRVLVGVALVSVISIALQRDFPLWSVVGVMIVAPSMGAPTFGRVLSRLGGAGLGAFLGYTLGFVFAQQQEVQVMAMVGLAGACTYLQLWGGYQPSSVLLVSILALVVAYPAVVLAEPGGDGAWMRFSEIALGILMSAIVNATMWPERAADALKRMLSQKLGRAPRLQVIPHATRPAVTSAAEADRLGTQLQVLRNAAAEDRQYARRAGAWTTIICAIEEVDIAILQYREWEQSDDCARSAEGFRRAAHDCFEQLLSLPPQLAARIEAVTPSEAPDTDPPLVATSDAALAAFRGMFKPQSGQAGPNPAAIALQACVRIHDALQTIEEEHRFANDMSDPMTAHDREVLRSPPLFPLDPAIVTAAVKTSAAVLACLLLGTVMNWSLGVLLMAITAFMGAIPSVGAFVQRMELRLVGGIVGMGLAIVARIYLLPHMESLGGLELVIAIFCAPLAYVAICGPSVALIGFQALIFFNVGMLTEPRLSDDLSTMLTRMSAIFLAAIILFGTQRFIFPAVGSRILPERFSRLAQGLARLLSTNDLPLAGTEGARFTAARMAVSMQIWSVAEAIGDAQYEVDIGLPLTDQSKATEALYVHRAMTRRVDEARDAVKRLLAVPAPEGAEAIAAEFRATRGACQECLLALADHWRHGEPARLASALARAHHHFETLDALAAEARQRPDYGNWSADWLLAARARRIALESLVKGITHAAELAGPTTLNRAESSATLPPPQSATLPAHT